MDNLCETGVLLLSWIHFYANLSRARLEETLDTSRMSPCARLEETLDTSRINHELYFSCNTNNSLEFFSFRLFFPPFLAAEPEFITIFAPCFVRDTTLSAQISSRIATSTEDLKSNIQSVLEPR